MSLQLIVVATTKLTNHIRLLSRHSQRRVIAVHKKSVYRLPIPLKAPPKPHYPPHPERQTYVVNHHPSLKYWVTPDQTIMIRVGATCC